MTAIDRQLDDIVDGEFAPPDPPQQGFRDEPCPAAIPALVICAISRQQHANMHPVAASFQPRKETLRAVPDRVLPRAFTLDHPLPLGVVHLTPRNIRRDPAQASETDEVVPAFAVALALPRFHRAVFEAQRLVGNHQPVIDPDRAAEPAAGRTSPDRRIEGEQVRRRVPVTDPAVRAMQSGREGPGFSSSSSGRKGVDRHGPPTMF